MKFESLRTLGCQHILTTLSFQPTTDGGLAPYFTECGDILSPIAWKEIVMEVDRFYSRVAAEWVSQENERFQDEQARKYAAYQERIVERQAELPPPTGWIYIIRAGEYYKIGRAQNPIDRYSQLATLPPWPTEIVHTFEAEDYCEIEKQLHDLFASKRANGEWFALDEEDVEMLRSLE